MLTYQLSHSALETSLWGYNLTNALNSPQDAIYALDEHGFVVFVLFQVCGLCVEIQLVSCDFCFFKVLLYQLFSEKLSNNDVSSFVKLTIDICVKLVKLANAIRFRSFSKTLLKC